MVGLLCNTSLCIFYADRAQREERSLSLASCSLNDYLPKLPYNEYHHTMALSDKIPSPQATLIPFISAEEAAVMAYPPNALPGARDVETFYGSMRVYEWGPANGEKVLFVHGDATPCLVFSKIAQGLVDAGYRVMLFGKRRSRNRGLGRQ